MSRIVFTLVTFLLALASAQMKYRRPVLTLKIKSRLDLPHNATSIRENIIDNFSCQNRIYGYYADIDNDCQIFHVCLPQARSMIRFSFICPKKTVFNQVTFVCTRIGSSIPCQESPKYYMLNEELGKIEKTTDMEPSLNKNKQSNIKSSVKPNIEIYELPKLFTGKKHRK